MSKNRHFKVMNYTLENQLKHVVQGRTVNIWFNHWFSTAYHYIKHLKDTKVNNFNVLASNTREDTVYFEVANRKMIEPNIDKNSEEYIEFADKICNDFEIDVCFIHHGIKNFMENEFRHKFVKPCDLKSYEIANDKFEFLKLIKEKNLNDSFIRIPEHFKVHTADMFREAVKELGNKDICFKPISGIGGIGFNKLHSEKASMSNYLTEYGPHLTAKDVELLLEKEEKSNLMVMKYYDGNEYSLDCFAQKGELKVCIPRKKPKSKVKELEFNEVLIDFARKVAKELKMDNSFNIQLFQDVDDKRVYYINEINTRISGGAWVSELLGVNFCLMSILNTLNPSCEIKDTTRKMFETERYNQIEYPIKMG